MKFEKNYASLAKNEIYVDYDEKKWKNLNLKPPQLYNDN